MYQISEILKAIARDKDLHEGFRKNVLLYDAMLPMAKRYIIEESDKVIQQAQIYQKRGYGISLEYMGGEDTVSQEKCRSSVDKTIELIKTIDLNLKVSTVNVCFDLSTIGLVISEQLTLDNLNTIAEVAQEKDIQLILSMEEPKKIDSIL